MKSVENGLICMSWCVQHFAHRGFDCPLVRRGRRAPNRIGSSKEFLHVSNVLINAGKPIQPMSPQLLLITEGDLASINAFCAFSHFGPGRSGEAVRLYRFLERTPVSGS